MAVLNQMSGLSALNFYAGSIFEDIFKGGNAVAYGTAMTGFAQIAGVLISPCLGKKFSVKKILVVGTACCTVCMGMVALFAGPLDVPILTLVFILLFLVCFQASQGSFFFTYVAETAEDAGVAWANCALFTMILIYALITQDLFNSLGTAWTFAIFAICNFVATILLHVLLADIQGLSKAEAKAIYANGIAASKQRPKRCSSSGQLMQGQESTVNISQDTITDRSVSNDS